MRLKTLLAVFLLTIFSQSLFAGGDDSDDGSGNETLVIIQNFKFIPQHITIKRGKTVRWENREKRQYHSVWFEALGEEEPEDYLFADDSYERAFDKAGVFPYRCGPHPKMTGTVKVID